MRRLSAYVGRLGIAAAVLVLVGCGSAKVEKATADPKTLRTTQSGQVVGFQGQYDSYTWLGIPYAAAPVGELRWRAAQPPPSWSGTREALAFGSACPQYASMFGGVPGNEGELKGDEDCLFLNIWTPPTVGQRLPVMVWIHGGGNTIGHGGGFFNGGNLAVKENVVVITINYRLGPLGWFRHAALRSTAANDLDRSGNFATLDLVRALQWVHDNITAFGGDPDNVTIFGESAGAQNVFSLLLSPQARGLFHRGIAQSGGLWMSTPEEGENFSDVADGDENSSNEALARMLVADRKAADRNAAKAALAKMSEAEVSQFLRSRSTAQIFAAYPPNRTGMIEMPKVFAEGVVLPAGDPLDHFAHAGEYNRVPVIFGTNRDENKLFMFGDPQRVKMWFGILPRVRDEQWYNLSGEFLSKNWKATGADAPARAMRASENPEVFVYRFDWDEEPTRLGTDLSMLVGAAHGFEIPFVFGHFDLGKQGNVIFTSDNEPGRRKLSEQMMSYWAQFAYTGNPGRGRDGTQPEWKAWPAGGGSDPSFLVLDTTDKDGGGVRMSPDAVTVDGVLAAVEKDPRFPDQRDRCRVFRELAEWSRGFTKEEYAKKSSCAEFPYDGYPWG